MTETTTTQFDEPSSLIMLVVHYPLSSAVASALSLERWSLDSVKVNRTFYAPDLMIDNQQLALASSRKVVQYLGALISFTVSKLAL